MTWINPLTRNQRRHPEVDSIADGPAPPPALARRVERLCAILGAPVEAESAAWKAAQAAMAVYAAETPPAESVVQLYAGDGRATAALAAGTRFAKRPALWAIDAWTGAESGLGLLRRNLVSTGLEREVLPVSAGPVLSAGAWDGSPVGLLVIDAGAGVSTCMAAYSAWSPHLADGARIIFHGPANATAGHLLWGGALEPLFGVGYLRVCAHHALPAARDAASILRRAA